MKEMEDRVGSTDDRVMRHERAIRYLQHRGAKLTEKCTDLENRARRKNLRIHGVAEGK